MRDPIGVAQKRSGKDRGRDNFSMSPRLRAELEDPGSFECGVNFSQDSIRNHR